MSNVRKEGLAKIIRCVNVVTRLNEQDNLAIAAAELAQLPSDVTPSSRYGTLLKSLSSAFAAYASGRESRGVSGEA